MAEHHIPPLRMCLALCEGHAYLADGEVVNELRDLGWAPVFWDAWGANDPRPHVVVRCEEAEGNPRIRQWGEAPLVFAGTGDSASPSERARAWHRAAIASLNLLYAPADPNFRGRRP